jgi:hypothetical protein
LRNEREIWVSRDKPQEHQKNAEDQTIFAEASRILELGEAESLTVSKLKDALRVRELSLTGLKNVLASRLIEYESEQLTPESAEMVPPPTLASGTDNDDIQSEASGTSSEEPE